MDDPFDLRRFVDAQDPCIERVLAELGAGRKRSHWMWFVFPQVQGLGHSAMARAYALASADEARAYLRHPVLGARLDRCTRLVLAVPDTPLEDVLGGIDALKFQSCMTLFAAVSDPPNVFDEALRVRFGGRADPATLARLQDRPR